MTSRVFFCSKCGAYLPESVGSCPCGFVIPIAEPEEHEGRSLREPGGTFPPAPPSLSVEPTPSPTTKLLAPKTSARLLAGLLVLFAIIAAVLFFKQHEGSRGSKPGEHRASIVGASDDASSLSKVSPASTAAGLFIGKWQLVEGELHPVTKEVVKSFLTIAGTPDKPTVVWTSELDGSVGHTISVKYTRGSLTGDYYGGKGARYSNGEIIAIGDPHDFYSYTQYHHDYPAADILCPPGSAFVSPIGGVVDFVSVRDEWNPKSDRPELRGGLSVAILGDDGWRYYGSHLQSVADGIGVGTRVKQGQLLGRTGSSGNARGTSPHLHFGISRPTTPFDWKVRRGEVPPFKYLKLWAAAQRAH